MSSGCHWLCQCFETAEIAPVELGRLRVAAHNLGEPMAVRPRAWRPYCRYFSGPLSVRSSKAVDESRMMIRRSFGCSA